MCGENSKFTGTSLYGMGSPPHVRGKLHDAFPNGDTGRITPACAGKTLAASYPCHISRDHPRMCGENSANNLCVNALLGSPPHVRGKHVNTTALSNIDRITPACAGKTSPIMVAWPWIVDHPRMCGENDTIAVQKYSRLGSPPHVRGKLESVEHDSLGHRITPACAGKTC